MMLALSTCSANPPQRVNDSILQDATMDLEDWYGYRLYWDPVKDSIPQDATMNLDDWYGYRLYWDPEELCGSHNASREHSSTCQQHAAATEPPWFSN